MDFTPNPHSCGLPHQDNSVTSGNKAIRGYIGA